MSDRLFYATFKIIGKGFYIKVYAKTEDEAKEKLKNFFIGTKRILIYHSEEEAQVERFGLTLWGEVA
jgi:hypothetical protein